MITTVRGASTWAFGPGGGGNGGVGPIRDLTDVDPTVPDTLGWRAWRFYNDHLISPTQGIEWPDAELRVSEWDESDVVRGVAGIHALLVPVDWKFADPLKCGVGSDVPVHGIVERFGQFVLGTEGWRAEWVVVRELATRDKMIAKQLKKTYPDVVVHHIKQTSEVIQ